MAVERIEDALEDTLHDEDWGLYLRTAALVFLAALGVSGGSHLFMILTKNPLIKQHKATLEFWSAWIGDGVLLPVVSIFMIRALRHWRVRPGGAAWPRRCWPGPCSRRRCMSSRGAIRW